MNQLPLTRQVDIRNAHRGLKATAKRIRSPGDREFDKYPSQEIRARKLSAGEFSE